MEAAVAYLSSLGHPLPDGTLRLDSFDPKSQAVVEAPSSARLALPPAPSGQAGPARPARLVSYGAQRVEVEVPPGEPGLLVLTDSYFPGWEATVNGKPAKVLATDVAFRGVLLGAGESHVVFSYHSPGGKLGWGIPLLAVCCLIGTGVVRRRFWWTD